MRKYILILFAILINLASCNTQEGEGKIDSRSIFQLNSIWETHKGEKIKLADLKGKTLVISMIYTSCKTACPQLTGEMSSIEKGLGKYDPDKVRFVFVSIDPMVDTPEKMTEYFKLNEFEGDQWLFLRSDEVGTREFANVLSMKYKEISPLDFSHSNIISIFSENGVLAYQKEGLNPDVSDLVSEVKSIL